MSSLALFGRPVLAGSMIPKVFTDLISTTIARLLVGSGAPVDQHQSNALFGVHQLRVVLPGDTMAYRVIVAPANAPISIGGVSADEHFAEPLRPVAVEDPAQVQAAQ